MLGLPSERAACALFVPAALSALRATLGFWWRHGGPGVLLACGMVSFPLGNAAYEAWDDGTLFDHAAGVWTGLVGAEHAPLVVFLLPFANGLVTLRAA